MVTQTQKCALQSVFAGQNMLQQRRQTHDPFCRRAKAEPKNAIARFFCVSTRGPPQEAENQLEIRTGGPRSLASARATRPLLWSPTRLPPQAPCAWTASAPTPGLPPPALCAWTARALVPGLPSPAPRASRSASLPRARAPRPPRCRRRPWDNRETNTRRNRWSRRRRTVQSVDGEDKARGIASFSLREVGLWRRA
jgi:hypothetical protein